MKKHSVRWSWMLLPLVLVGTAWSVESRAAEPADAVDRLEADWLRQAELRSGPVDLDTPAKISVTPEEDAAGGCDGVKDGKWGFHTLHEERPWWQVDLGRKSLIDAIRLYNRCDNKMGERNVRLLVLFSDDGQSWRQVYQHDGTSFLGFPDKKPLVVPMHGAETRYVRLQLPGTNYFHLDEVEIHATAGDKNTDKDKGKNIALGQPATQSSVSQWSAKGPTATAATGIATSTATVIGPLQIAKAIERGRLLNASLRELGAGGAGGAGDDDVDQATDALDQLDRDFKTLPADASDEVRQKLYIEARRSVRKMALANPLLDFDTILFVKRAPGMFPHVCDQYYGWWSRPGGGICLLKDFKTEEPRVECITRDWAAGNFLRPDLSYDGRRVLFAYCKHYPDLARVSDKVDKEALPEDSFYKIFEMDLDGGNMRQLTFGRYDDFDARYLPDGRIVFLSTRKGTALQAGRASAEATCDVTRPDSYVRCGGGNQRPVSIFTLHKMDGDGRGLHAISAFESFEWTPSITSDGRVIYARWDYIDRFNGHFFSLWSTNPDGTGSQLVYGNYTTRPQCVFEARPIPGSQKLVFTATAHHSITGGSLCLLDRTRGTEFDRPITRLTPEVPFPETERNVDTYYAGPFPLSEDYFLVGWSDRRLPSHKLMWDDDPRNPRNAMGVYLYDAFGNLELLHRDPDISSMYPTPVRPRRKPPIRPDVVDWQGPQEGRFLIQNVYQGLDDVARGSVKRLRVVAVPPKPQPQKNLPVLGVSKEEPGKFVLGTVPVEEDGSVHFRVPSGLPVFFQALDDAGLAVQTMRSLTYVQPDETLSCIGCHESRDSAPPTGTAPLAALREPSKLAPGPPGSWPLRFDRLVQPVLDQHCVDCHRPESDDAVAARFDLSPARAYENLMAFADKDLEQLAFEKDASTVGACVAANSKLLELLIQGEGHQGVRLDPKSFDRLVTWMDVYAQRQGSFSEAQEEELRQFRQAWAHLLVSKEPSTE